MVPATTPPPSPPEDRFRPPRRWGRRLLLMMLLLATAAEVPVGGLAREAVVPFRMDESAWSVRRAVDPTASSPDPGNDSSAESVATRTRPTLTADHRAAIEEIIRNCTGVPCAVDRCMHRFATEEPNADSLVRVCIARTVKSANFPLVVTAADSARSGVGIWLDNPLQLLTDELSSTEEPDGSPLGAVDNRYVAAALAGLMILVKTALLYRYRRSLNRALCPTRAPAGTEVRRPPPLGTESFSAAAAAPGPGQDLVLMEAPTTAAAPPTAAPTGPGATVVHETRPLHLQ